MFFWRTDGLEDGLDDLPVLVPGDVLDVVEAASQSLVVLQARLQEVDQVLLCLLVAGLEHDKAPGDLTVLLVRDGDDGGVCHARVGEQPGLQHAGRDLVHPEGDQGGNLSSIATLLTIHVTC